MEIVKMKNKKQQEKNLIRRKRYQVLRAMGYSSKEAQRMRHIDIDLSGLRFRKSTGELITGTKTNKRLNDIRRYIETGSVERELYKVVAKAKKYDSNPRLNKTVYSSWGLVVHGEEHKESTMKAIKRYAIKHGLTEEQAYYLTYLSYKHGCTLDEAREMAVTNEGVWVIS